MITFTAETTTDVPDDVKEHIPAGTELVRVMVTIPAGYALVEKMGKKDIDNFEPANELPVKERLQAFLNMNGDAFTESLRMPGDPSLSFPLTRVRGDRFGGGDLTVHESRKITHNLVDKYFGTYEPEEVVRMFIRVQAEPESLMLVIEEALDQYKGELQRIVDAMPVK
jgi:hypothetical protein